MRHSIYRNCRRFARILGLEKPPLSGFQSGLAMLFWDLGLRVPFCPIEFPVEQVVVVPAAHGCIHGQGPVSQGVALHVHAARGLASVD